MRWTRRARAAAVIGGCVWCGLAPRVAAAEPSSLLGRDNPLAGLMPTPTARAAAERERLERELETALRALPGVTHADIVLSLASSDSAPLDQALPAPRASVILRVRQEAAAIAEERARKLVDAALPQGSHVHVDVSPVTTRSHAPTRGAETQTQVGPFWVAERSARSLRATLAACLMTNAGLAAWILRQRWRR